MAKRIYEVTGAGFNGISLHNGYWYIFGIRASPNHYFEYPEINPERLSLEYKGIMLRLVSPE